MARLRYFHTFAGASKPPQIELADRLLGLVRSETPFTIAARVFFGLSDSDANDTQVKSVRAYNNINILGRPEKKKIIARNVAYQGVFVAAASLTGLPAVRAAFDLSIDGILYAPRPHYYGGTRTRVRARRSSASAWRP